MMENSIEAKYVLRMLMACPIVSEVFLFSFRFQYFLKRDFLTCFLTKLYYLEHQYSLLYYSLFYFTYFYIYFLVLLILGTIVESRMHEKVR